jgi:hypothetical protein
MILDLTEECRSALPDFPVRASLKQFPHRRCRRQGLVIIRLERVQGT